MNHLSNASESQPPAAIGLLLSQDLIFTTKIVSTSREFNCRIVTAGTPVQAEAMIAQHHPCAVFVDLAAHSMVQPAQLRRYRELAGGSVSFIAFGSHVDREALNAAAEAGCDPVLPRSRFTIELPRLIQQHLVSTTLKD